MAKITIRSEIERVLEILDNGDSTSDDCIDESRALLESLRHRLSSSDLDAEMFNDTPAPRFEVHMHTMCGGWENVWQEDDKPQTFASEAEAQAEIDEFLADIAAEIASGDRAEDEGYDREDFRIVPAGDTIDPLAEMERTNAEHDRQMEAQSAWQRRNKPPGM